MTTGTLANVLHYFVLAGFYFAHANEALLTGFKDEPLDRGQLGKAAWLICLVMQGYKDVVVKWSVKSLLRPPIITPRFHVL